MVSTARFKSSSQHDVRLLNDGPIPSKIDDNAGYALGQGYLDWKAANTVCPWVLSQIQIQPTLSFQIMITSGYKKKHKMLTTVMPSWGFKMVGNSAKTN